jgi:hypothetical protein
VLSSRHSDHPVLVAITACNASASEQPVGYSQAADAFLPQTESPVLFVGQNRGSGFGTGGLQGDLLPEHYLFGEHRAVRVCSAQPSEGDISGMYEIRRAAFLQGRCVGVGHVLSAGSLWQPERDSRPGNRSELRRAQFLLNADLKKRISRYLRDHRSPRHYQRVLVFEGTVRDPVPQPMPCKVQPLVPINYDVEQVVRGDWTDTGSHRLAST